MDAERRGSQDLLWREMLKFSAYKRVLTLQGDSLEDGEGETASFALSVLALQHLRMC